MLSAETIGTLSGHPKQKGPWSLIPLPFKGGVPKWYLNFGNYPNTPAEGALVKLVARRHLYWDGVGISNQVFGCIMQKFHSVLRASKFSGFRSTEV